MGIGAGGLIALSESFGGMTRGSQVLDSLERQMRAFGATHVLIAGMPMPGRSIDPLVLRMNWGDLRTVAAVKAEDPVLQRAFRSRHPCLWIETPGQPIGDSVLLANLGEPGSSRLLLVPICAFLPYQAVAIAGGARLSPDVDAMLSVEHLFVAAFRRLFDLGHLRRERPGELSGRERRVLELSATGKTANEIADILQISQRTVHAHLQNASEKLGAGNKTHTVVEALRYGQISV
jgi:DNA-binding CsgD family transcriptional regulator